MISLHRPDGTALLVNVTHIVTVETTPDTLITLYNGDKLRIKESGSDVGCAINAWFHRIAGRAVVPFPSPPTTCSPDDDKEE